MRQWALETTLPGAANRTYRLLPAGTVANYRVNYSEEQQLAILLVEHTRGLRTLTPEQVASLTASIPEDVLAWATRLPSAS